MAARRIPTYAEIASFREKLIKSQKTLGQTELDKQCSQLIRMEFSCLRAIASLSERSDQELMYKAQRRARLEHIPFNLEKYSPAEPEAA
mgnify:CR=1 FL=1